MSRATNWHSLGLVLAAVIVILPLVGRRFGIGKGPDVSPPPASRPVPRGRTAFAIGAGCVALAVGFVGSAVLREAYRDDESLVQAFVLGLWGALAAVSFGPGTFIAREGWRRRRPDERRGDRRAAVLAGLGMAATVGAVLATALGSPVLRRELLGSATAGPEESGPPPVHLAAPE